MLKKYGFFGTVRLIISLIYTKLFFPKARIIRLPFDIRNRHLAEIGKGFTTGFGCRIESVPVDRGATNCIRIGNNVQINDYVHIAAGESITIGNNVLIASRVFVSDLNHGSYSGDHHDSPLIPPNDRKLSTKPVVISDNVWIGEGVCVMPGVTLGSGSIIGASSVVTKDIPPNAIAVGSPAKVVKIYDFEKEIWERIEHGN
jgi:acetyltransferase-like isoleucine patch superfamily enzyme